MGSMDKRRGKGFPPRGYFSGLSITPQEPRLQGLKKKDKWERNCERKLGQNQDTSVAGGQWRGTLQTLHIGVHGMRVTIKISEK